MTIFTIGYEGLDITRFIKLLKRFGVDTLVDVRERAQSRKKGFSKTALSNALSESGIDYLHIPRLGCPKPIRDQYYKDGNWNRYTKHFLDHLDSQADSLDQLSDRASESTCALLCFEADFNYCHRSLVADAVQTSTGSAIEHILKDAIKSVAVAPREPLVAAVGR
jgi:uncharacterized protein (DUF488 family)